MQTKIPFLFFLFVLPLALGDLRVGFYQSTCPQAESIVFQVVQNRFKTDPSVTAALLRLHFHDCFVRGCDASILIDPTNKKQSEKQAGPNQTVRGYEIIDEIKNALEAACPSMVSCADIIALAAKDAVALAGGPNYSVPTGRRDGLVSNIGDVNLPGPQLTVPEAFQFFRPKGFTVGEMVTLLGAHTVGVAHCSFFQERVSNGAFDPTMDSNLAANLSKICASSNSDPSVFMDQSTGFVFDNEYYKQLLLKRGIMQIDQELSVDGSSAGFVSSFARNGIGFKQSFGNAMVKLGTVEVLVGNAGEVRTNCRVFNAQKKPMNPNLLF
ncbi:peroxidase 44 [Ricinus communis]|uniref:Peroxidase n=1 Tax=Ricinus communis TaxID=3988 RepID=B9SI53_RICCO|nr:peroxidase 44 [Ricinus communis]EEF36655.1 Peroxidase 44 precursor, putative [Ricinus communis]|eukprot:XP_002525672.1 peroxidase 44 [Ricinus communis]